MKVKENGQFITCPECGKDIQLTQALMINIETDLKKKYQYDYEQKLKDREKKVKDDTTKAVAEKFETDLTDLKNQVSEKDKRLKELTARELELNKKERELADQESSIQLKVNDLLKQQIAEVEKKTKDDTEKLITEKYETDLEKLKTEVDEKNTKLKAAEAKEEDLKEREEEVKRTKQNLEKDFADRIKEAKVTLTAEAKQKAKEETIVEVEDIKNQLDDYKKKYTDAQQKEIELRKQKNQLEIERQDFELNKQRELDAAKDEIYQKAKNESETDYKLKIRDKDQKLDQYSKTIEELNRKLEQGSQQAQGESQELELEELLKHNFPSDDIVPVAKGVKGADVIQRVKNQFGFECGTILWESKRHKRYDPKWVAKLKEDQRNEKANVSVLITQVLPDNILTFDLQDGVYIGSFNSSIGIASALREQLIQIQILRQSEVGKNQKMESMYNYLTSHEFAQRISAILEAFELLQKQVNDERKAFEKQWAAREKMLRQVIKNTSGLHGDLKGLIGASLPDIEALQLPEAAETSSPESSVEEISGTDDLPF